MFSVIVITYNQEAYLEQTLSSILSQKHEYSYEILIGDDASRDMTQDIIAKYVSEYPNIIKPIYNKTNMGLVKNYYNTYSHCNGKYIMCCAGDDFWKEGKVNKQIKFMEENPRIGMCYGKAYVFNDDRITDEIGNERNQFLQLLIQNCVPAVTACIRNEVMKRYLEEIAPINKGWRAEDYPMWLWISKNYGMGYLDDVLAYYRVMPESVSHSTKVEKKIEFANSIDDVVNYFAEKYNVWGRQKHKEKRDRRNLMQVYVGLLKQTYDKNYARQFRRCYKSVHHKSYKLRIYYICSFSKYFWKGLHCFIRFSKLMFTG